MVLCDQIKICRQAFGDNITPEMEKMAQERKSTFIQQIEEESSAYYTSSRMIDDGVIDPRDTRSVIGFCLSVVHSEKVEGGNLYGVSRM
jgi:acetyl-CoA carboxylase carboxyltransferase component